MTIGLKKEILAINDPALRLNAIFGLAVVVYDDFELARDFALEQHRGHTGIALGAPDMEAFVDVTELAQTPEGTRRAVEFLQDRLVRSRLTAIFGSAADTESFMARFHPALGMSPTALLREKDNGYEIIMECLDAAEAGVYI